MVMSAVQPLELPRGMGCRQALPVRILLQADFSIGSWQPGMFPEGLVL